MANREELRDLYQKEQAERLKLDALVCESHACLRAAQEHLKHGREGEGWLLLDAATRILSTHAEG